MARTAIVVAAGVIAGRHIVPDDMLLFRHSALTFNGHRIHCERRYVTEVKGYPGLIAHGLLIDSRVGRFMASRFTTCGTSSVAPGEAFARHAVAGEWRRPPRLVAPVIARAPECQRVYSLTDMQW